MAGHAGDKWPVGGGEMGERIRAFDWASTPLGPSEAWSPALRNTVGLMVTNRFPLLLWWGPNYIQIYNDAYSPILGSKHPHKALGRPVSECWHVLQPLIDTPYNGGLATWMEDIELDINRYGFTEESHFTIAYSPVPDETMVSGIGGVLATVHEITGKVVSGRRVALLRELGARVINTKAEEEACRVTTDILAHHPKDVPFALLYIVDPSHRHARLAGWANIDPGLSESPLTVELDGSITAVHPWPLAEALQNETMQVIEDVSARVKRVPPGPWSDATRQAVIVPIQSNFAH